MLPFEWFLTVFVLFISHSMSSRIKRWPRVAVIAIFATVPLFCLNQIKRLLRHYEKLHDKTKLRVYFECCSDIRLVLNMLTGSDSSGSRRQSRYLEQRDHKVGSVIWYCVNNSATYSDFGCNLLTVLLYCRCCNSKYLYIPSIRPRLRSLFLNTIGLILY